MRLVVLTNEVVCIMTDVTTLTGAEVVVEVLQEVVEAGIEVIGKESEIKWKFLITWENIQRIIFGKIHIYFINIVRANRD